MKDFDWRTFKGRLTMQGLTITDWLKQNDIDYIHYKNMRYAGTKPTERETKLFNKVIEG